MSGTVFICVTKDKEKRRLRISKHTQLSQVPLKRPEVSPTLPLGLWGWLWWPVSTNALGNRYPVPLTVHCSFHMHVLLGSSPMEHKLRNLLCHLSGSDPQWEPNIQRTIWLNQWTSLKGSIQTKAHGHKNSNSLCN